MEKRRKIEREFGIPIPGEILEQPQWTKTALKKLPAEGPIDLAGLFGRQAPLILDIGCGNGRFTLASAIERRHFDHLAVDVLPVVLRYATRRANQRGLSNVRFAACDGLRLVGSFLAPGSTREVHCYHPQPFHDFRDRARRLITPQFLAATHLILEPMGAFYFQTDNEPYWDYVQKVAPAFFDFRVQESPWPDALKGRTRREIIAIRKGLPIFRGWGTARPMEGEQRDKLRNELPSPDFDAGAGHPDLDSLE